MKSRIRFFVSVGVFCFLFVSAGNSFAQNFKVGYVNISKIFYSYYKTQKEMKQWQSDQIAQEDKITDLQKDIKTLQDAYNKQKNMLKPADVQKRKAEINKKTDALINFENQANQTLTKEKDDMITSLITDIKAEIKDFAQKGKYDLILDSQAIEYSSGDDLTNQVISALNKGKS